MNPGRLPAAIPQLRVAYRQNESGEVREQQGYPDEAGTLFKVTEFRELRLEHCLELESKEHLRS